jgi:hypothetical protein
MKDMCHNLSLTKMYPEVFIRVIKEICWDPTLRLHCNKYQTSYQSLRQKTGTYIEFCATEKPLSVQNSRTESTLGTDCQTPIPAIIDSLVICHQSVDQLATKSVIK